MVRPREHCPDVTVAVETRGNTALRGDPLCSDLKPDVPLRDTSFVVMLSQVSGQPMSVDVSWSGTAVSDVDYTNHPSSVTVPAGASNVTVPADITQSAGGKTIV